MSENVDETQNQNQNENNDNDGSTDVSGLSVEQLKEELSKVRREAASRRIENRDLKEKADKWSQYEESQKTEMQKLQDALAQREQELSGLKLERTKVAIAREVGLDADDAELLSGTDEAKLREQAEKLKARLQPKQDKQPPADLLAGKRGAPVGTGADTVSMDALIRASARRNQIT